MNFTNYGVIAALLKLGFYKEAAATAKYDPTAIERILFDPWDLPPKLREQRLHAHADQLMSKLYPQGLPSSHSASVPPVDPFGQTGLADVGGTRSLRTPLTPKTPTAPATSSASTASRVSRIAPPRQSTVALQPASERVLQYLKRFGKRV
jgi:hypothetical protein